MDRKIKVLVVDDHEMVRMGLVTYLNVEDDIEVAGEAGDGEEAIKAAAKFDPDVILMDLLMEKMNGIEATKVLSKSRAKIIVLTSYLDDEMLFPVMEAGAFSYLLKTSTADEIASAIRKAVKEEPTFQGQVTQKMFRHMNNKPKHEELTKREKEVLCLIGQGKSNKEIGEELFIGIKTVKTHVSHILAKLELEDRTQAAIYAHKHHLV
ncbi:response regulator transcription factor [Salipaludibacillus aurantiacus]|uniref:Two-component system, NarL family, response regulator LiaR n=1 Tax=Salipaludibacillus aurantiacus TaxID=1601833 RepID=A0A1H9TDM6_9BACI|nr:response regulator transcription factor [Salipaludibacillus aurantiacus]SER94713.1 two-component system, NarL family, response regulator LiaR [Salipaludibacillus aurantiacus]